jgi:hypothetical protein
MISPNAPASATTVRFAVADPTQLLKTLTLSVNVAGLACAGCRPSSTPGWTDMVVTLPTGELAGSGRTITVTSPKAWAVIATRAQDNAWSAFAQALVALGIGTAVFLVRRDRMGSAPNDTKPQYAYAALATDVESATVVDEDEDDERQGLLAWSDI